MRNLILTLVFTLSYSTFACMGSSIQLNDDTKLMGDGIVSGKEHLKIDELKELKYIGINLESFNKSGTKTHDVVVLGYNGDDGGIISTSFFVKETETGNEKVLFLKTNYIGDGVHSKSMFNDEKLTSDNVFDGLFKSGC